MIQSIFSLMHDHHNQIMKYMVFDDDNVDDDDPMAMFDAAF